MLNCRGKCHHWNNNALLPSDNRKEGRGCQQAFRQQIAAAASASNNNAEEDEERSYSDISNDISHSQSQYPRA